MVGYWGLGGTIMFNFKSIVNAVVNSDSIATKVIGYTALAAVGIGADIISAGAKKAEVAEAPAPVIVTEVNRDEDVVTEVVHDEDVVTEVIHDDTVEEAYDDSADREAEDELIEAAIKSTSHAFVLACEEAIETRKYGDEDAAVVMEEMAKSYLSYLHSFGKEDEYLVVHNVREALAAFRTFGAGRIEWM